MHRAAAGPFLCGSRNSKNSPEVVPLFYWLRKFRKYPPAGAFCMRRKSRNYPEVVPPFLLTPETPETVPTAGLFLRGWRNCQIGRQLPHPFYGPLETLGTVSTGAPFTVSHNSHYLCP